MNATSRNFVVVTSPSSVLSKAVLRLIHDGRSGGNHRLTARKVWPPPHHPPTTATRNGHYGGRLYHHQRSLVTRRADRFQNSSSIGSRCRLSTAMPKDPLPPRPAVSSSQSTSSTTTTPLSPAQAKQRYLESKRRTDAFLNDPQGTVQRLNTEMNETKARAAERLEREVYNKSIWQRLVDPLKRKQHSLINMVAATLAYILAHQLHLKRKAYQEVQIELDAEREKTKKLQSLLRSLMEDDCVNELADAAAGRADTDSLTAVRRNGMFGWWRTSARSRRSSLPTETEDKIKVDSGRLGDTQHASLVGALRSVLEARIGDEGLDDETKKQKALEKIWEENKERLKQKGTEPGANNNTEELDTSTTELDAIVQILPHVILEENEGNSSDNVPSYDQPSTTGKPRRVFDM